MKLPSGAETVFNNRFRWARFNLREAGLIESSSIGEVKITPTGVKVFKSKKKLTKDRLSTRPSGVKSKSTQTNRGEDKNVEDQLNARIFGKVKARINKTPDEQIQEIIDSAEKNLPEELLELLLVQDSTFFEKVVIELIEKLYGSVETSEHRGGSNDQGIDGVVKPDKFGFEAIYIQAKRYKKAT